jgi:hypothetical protein
MPSVPRMRGQLEALESIARDADGISSPAFPVGSLHREARRTSSKPPRGHLSGRATVKRPSCGARIRFAGPQNGFWATLPSVLDGEDRAP